jgi:hypothetical protein
MKEQLALQTQIRSGGNKLHRFDNLPTSCAVSVLYKSETDIFLLKDDCPTKMKKKL